MAIQKKTALIIRLMKIGDIKNLLNTGSNEKGFQVSENTIFWTKGELEKWVIKNRDDILLIAESGEDLRGYAFSMFHPPTGIGLITNIYVTEAYRHIGIAQLLITESIRLLKEKGATYVYAQVESTNIQSLKIFQDTGFTKGKDFTWVEQILH
ncbi:MAG: GNAT family N-acetyltransferase [bacterium]|nr:GNAT family N-acetyltransferase [bacterium]